MRLEDLTRAVPLVATDYCIVEKRRPDGGRIDGLHLPLPDDVLDGWWANGRGTDGRLWVSVGGLDWLWVEDTEGALKDINAAAATALERTVGPGGLPVMLNRRRGRDWESVADECGLTVTRGRPPAPASAPRATLLKTSSRERGYLEAETFALLGEVGGDPQAVLLERLAEAVRLCGGDPADPDCDLAWLDAEADDGTYLACGLVREVSVTADPDGCGSHDRHDAPWAGAA